jgi:hypothetical protein
MPDLRVFTLVLFYLLFVSGLFAYIINDKESAQIQNSLTVDLNTGNIASIQDYSVNDSYYSENLISNGFITAGTWVRSEDVGLILTKTGLIGTGALTIKNIVPVNGIYDVTYVINNSVHQPFSIFPQYVESSDMIEIYLDSSGYHQPKYWFGLPFPLGDNFFLSDTTLMSYDEIVLRSIFNTNTKTLKIYNNQTELFEIKDGLSVPLSIATKYYAGVSSNTEEFTLVKIYSRVSNTPISTSVDIFSFIETLFKLLFWSVDEIYMPLPLNILIIKFPLFLLIVFGVMIVRGV